MYSYLVLSLSLVAVSVLIVVLFRLQLPSTKLLVILFIILAVAMFVFDSYLTSLAVVMYNSKSVLAVRLGTIPLEDFGYLIAVVILVPALFERFYHDKKD